MNNTRYAPTQKVNHYRYGEALVIRAYKDQWGEFYIVRIHGRRGYIVALLNELSLPQKAEASK